MMLFKKWLKCGSRIVLIGCSVSDAHIKADLALFERNLEDSPYFLLGDEGAQYLIKLPADAVGLSGKARVYNAIFERIK